MATLSSLSVNQSKARAALNTFHKFSRTYEPWPFDTVEDLILWLEENVSPNFMTQFGASIASSGLTSTQIDEAMEGAADLMEGHWNRLSWQVLYDALIGKLKNWASFDFVKDSLSSSLKQAIEAGGSVVSSATTAAKFYPWIWGIGGLIGVYLLASKAGGAISRGASRVYSDASRRFSR